METLPTDTTDTTTKSFNVTLSTSLDRAGELQILSQGKSINTLEVKGIPANISIKTFDDWTLTASHGPTSAPVTWDVDRSGGVSYTLTNSSAIEVTVVATQQSTSTQKKKAITVTVKPGGSGKGGGWGQPGEDEGPGHGHGHGHG